VKNKKKQNFLDSIPCLCSGAKSRFFIAKSVFFDDQINPIPVFPVETRALSPFRSAGRATSPRFKLSKISASPWIQILPLPWCQWRNHGVNSLP